MAGSYKKAPRKDDRQPPTVALQREIEEQTAAFLKRGGEIQYICKGVSGQVIPPPRQPVPTKKNEVPQAAPAGKAAG